MKTVYIFMIILILAIIVRIANQGHGFLITQVLPFMGGHDPGIYDIAGLSAIIIAALYLISPRRKDDD
ncbi:MAG: hypothetical protein JW709_12825 [Sedimentisphaerales bacterium]|nr:hypothetical protein [Sedimentisphaerales bacterium]